VRGELVAVLDLRRRLGLPARAVALSDALVMVTVHDRQLLLLVDEATSVEAIPQERIRDAEELVPGASYLRDVAATPTGPLVIHDLEAFLSTVDLTRLEEALRTRGTRAVNQP
jgi:purine-binding chemotaxis protein CheW